MSTPQSQSSKYMVNNIYGIHHIFHCHPPQASTMDAQPTLTTVRDSLCQLAAAIHTSAAKDGTPVASHTPSRCFTNQAPTL